MPDDQTSPWFFFCVSAAPTPESPPGDREPVCLWHEADARFLEELLAPLYSSDGISLLTSDDEVIPPHKLDALGAAIRSAVDRIERQPERWPVHVGNAFIPFQEKGGDPLHEGLLFCRK